MVDAPIWPAGPTLMDGTDDPVVELAREMGMPEYEEDARAWILARGRESSWAALREYTTVRNQRERGLYS